MLRDNELVVHRAVMTGTRVDGGWSSDEGAGAACRIWAGGGAVRVIPWVSLASYSLSSFLEGLVGDFPLLRLLLRAHCNLPDNTERRFSQCVHMLCHRLWLWPRHCLVVNIAKMHKLKPASFVKTSVKASQSDRSTSC